MRKFKVDFVRTQYFSVDVTLMEGGKDEMDAVQIAMLCLDKDENPFFKNETITHEVEEIEWDD